MLVDRYGSLRQVCMYCQRPSAFAALSMPAIDAGAEDSGR